MSATNLKPITCYGVYRTPNCQQEWYETASRDAGRRARVLRNHRLNPVVSPMGYQVTKVGRVKMTLLTVYFPDPMNPPEIPYPPRVVDL